MVIDEDTLFKEVDLMSDHALEQYVPTIYAPIRKLGNLILKVSSKIEDLLDSIIISWNERLSDKTNLREILPILMKYRPLLSHMYLSGKIDAIKSYDLIKNDDATNKLLFWLNDLRNKFAHYSVYRHEIEDIYTNKNKRLEVLKKLKKVIYTVDVLKSSIAISNDNIK